MAIGNFLNNNDVAKVVNEAVAQATNSELKSLDLKGIIDTGNDPTIIGTFEQYTNALVNVLVKNFFSDSAYSEQYNDPYFIDSEYWGSVIQNIHVAYPSARSNPAYNNFQPDEQGVNKTVGVYEVFLPQVFQKLYGLTSSFAVEVTITGTQWRSAFRSESDMMSFVNYVKQQVDNGIIMKLEAMNTMNRNNYIAEKIAFAETDGSKGIHVINLVQLYHDSVDSNMTTASAFLSTSETLRWSATTIDLYSDYMKKMNKNFNTAEYDRFTPKDRQVLTILSDFDQRCRTFALATTYNPDYVKLKNYITVPSWQSTHSYDFETVSSIDVEVATGASDTETVKKSGIVALLCDRWAIMHTIKSRRTAVQPFNIEDLELISSQFADMYYNDLTQQGIVFTVEDITQKPEPEPEPEEKEEETK